MFGKFLTMSTSVSIDNQQRREVVQDVVVSTCLLSYPASIDFLWAEELDKHVYPCILELLESHSFNGHVSTESEKRKAMKRSASNGTGTHMREIRTLACGLEGNDRHDDDHEVVSAMNTPNASPLLDRNHTFSSQKSSRQSSCRTSRSFLEA